MHDENIRGLNLSLELCESSRCKFKHRGTQPVVAVGLERNWALPPVHKAFSSATLGELARSSVKEDRLVNVYDLGRCGEVSCDRFTDSDLVDYSHRGRLR